MLRLLVELCVVPLSHLHAMVHDARVIVVTPPSMLGLIHEGRGLALGDQHRCSSTYLMSMWDGRAGEEKGGWCRGGCAVAVGAQRLEMTTAPCFCTGESSCRDEGSAPPCLLRSAEGWP